MKSVPLCAIALLLAACGNSAQPSDEPESVNDNGEATAQPAIDDAEAAKRRETMIATWGAQFSLSEEQATCLVDSVQWDDMIAAEQSQETIAAITACEADPATCAGYGQ